MSHKFDGPLRLVSDQYKTDGIGDVVFVHGLDGDTDSTWSGGDGLFWPRWLAEDSPELSVWSVDYDAASTKWTGAALPLFDRAVNVLELLTVHNLGKRPLCFVTHSLGGLLVKKVIQEASESEGDYKRFAEMTRGVVFIATPHTGSDIARIVDFVKFLRPTVAVSELKAQAPALRDLNIWYRDHVDNLNIRNKVYFETQKTRNVQVVDAVSADPGIKGVTPIPLDANHVNISKPNSRGEMLYLGTRSFVTDVLVRPPPTDRQENIERVCDIDPIYLGVHRAITVVGARENVLPTYVSRDVDDAEDGIDSFMQGAKEVGGFLVLTGGSSTGKTRSAYESIRRTVPHYWLFHPSGPEEVRRFASRPTPQTIVWLDELQQYMERDDGLTVAIMRQLVRGKVITVGTIWPDYLDKYRRRPISAQSASYQRERDVVSVATIIVIDSRLSDAEKKRARNIAQTDRRINVAIGDNDYGMTQVLAAAPQLVRFWETARNNGSHHYAWAILTAAIDAARLGAKKPLSDNFLKLAAECYCDKVQKADAGDDWFQLGIEEASQPLNGAARALVPSAASIGDYRNHQVGDYLLQYASHIRRKLVPASPLWEIYVTAITDVDDLVTLARSAEERLLNREAATLYCAALKMGNVRVRRHAIQLMLRQGMQDEAIRLLRDATADKYALEQLIDLLTRAGREGEIDGILHEAAMKGDRNARRGLISRYTKKAKIEALERLLRHGVNNNFDGIREDVVQAVREAKSSILARAMRDVLLTGGRVERVNGTKILVSMGLGEAAVSTWREATQVAEPGARSALADLLVQIGKIDEAIVVWKEALLGDPRDWNAQERLARLLEKSSRTDEAIAIFQTGIINGMPNARADLTYLLERLRRPLEAAQIWLQVDPSDWASRSRGISILRRLGRNFEVLNCLRESAEAGSEKARTELANIFISTDRIDEAEDLYIRDLPDSEQALATFYIRTSQDAKAARILRDLLKRGIYSRREDLLLVLNRSGLCDDSDISLWNGLIAKDFPEARSQLASMLHALGRNDEAVEVWEAAVSVDVQGARQELVKLLLDLGRNDEAVEVWEAAVSVDVQGARQELVKLLLDLGRNEGEVEDS
ncbi:tetratricopeptide repeat protein, partial [Amycolatopsis sp. NPDC058278]|uniref:tetratricopeptide repeat protein n=1 Tax=Amycolatopsis sp. NPDC058278 TaxID=3346417 RepID=UPI0036DB4E43